MTRSEIEDMPLGTVFDQIACFQIAECGVREKRTTGGSLMEQMRRLCG